MTFPLPSPIYECRKRMTYLISSLSKSRVLQGYRYRWKIARHHVYNGTDSFKETALRWHPDTTGRDTNWTPVPALRQDLALLHKDQASKPSKSGAAEFCEVPLREVEVFKGGSEFKAYHSHYDYAAKWARKGQRA